MSEAFPEKGSAQYASYLLAAAASSTQGKPVKDSQS